MQIISTAVVLAWISLTGFGRAPDAAKIARAVAETARTVPEAALMVVFAEAESSLHARAVGDSGRSLGAWQMQRLAPRCAFDPSCAAQEFIRRIDLIRETCSMNTPDEQLAAYVSGSCSIGRKIVADRVRKARELAFQTAR